MATITVCVDNEIEKKFREKAMQEFGKKKGALGLAFNKAMTQWVEEKSNDAIAETIKLLEKGVNLGGISYKSRAELHER